MTYRAGTFTGLIAGLALLSACTENQSPIGNAVDEALSAGDRPAMLHLPPEIMDDLSTYPLAAGARLLVEGTGLLNNTTGSITVPTPPGATPVGALLYWGARTDTGDPSEILIDFNGDGQQLVHGDYAGTTPLASGDDPHTFRADLVAAGFPLDASDGGSNQVEVEVELDQGIEGAALVIPYTDGSAGFLTLRDGNDWAYLLQPAETELQEFSFAPVPQDRQGRLHIIVGDVEDNRPTRIDLEIEPGAPFNIENPFGAGQSGRDGPEWDTWMYDFTLPAGGDAVRVQVRSDNNVTPPSSGDPASLYWVVAALEIFVSGGQGCTPGYWKQPHHADSWTAPYAPGDLFSAHFEDAFSADGLTLLEVLKQGGGGLKALGRHTVAALLNAASPDVDYDLTPQQVIDMFNDVHPGSKQDYNGLKDEFAGFNEQGCPLN